MINLSHGQVFCVTKICYLSDMSSVIEVNLSCIQWRASNCHGVAASCSDCRV